MVVYAFYGMGKSTLCKQREDCVDCDFQYFLFESGNSPEDYPKALSEYADRVHKLEREGKTVFVNAYINGVGVAFFPKSYEACINMLDKRKQGNFIPSREEYDYMLDAFSADRTKVFKLEQGEFVGTVIRDNPDVAKLLGMEPVIESSGLEDIEP